MDIQFVPAAFADIRDEVRSHLNSLSSRINSYLEDHILQSRHYRVLLAGEAGGFASIHKESLITQFALAEPHRRYGQTVFQRLRKLEQVQSAYVPTYDEFFLCHALDDYRQFTKQAYLFRRSHVAQNKQTTVSYFLRLAELEDTEFIKQQSGTFLEPVERYMESKELFMVLSGDVCVGFGVIKRSALYENVGSIGMYTIESFRHKGIGTATLELLIKECSRNEIEAIAGCWYYNHASKKTLERAGLYAQARLLKIDY